MKKFIIFLGTLLVSIFLFNNNVRAEENYYIKKYYSSLNDEFVESNFKISDGLLNNIFMTDKELFIEYDSQTKYGQGYPKSLLNKIENGTFDTYLKKYDSWIILNDNSYNGDRIYFFNKEDIYLITINEGQSEPYFRPIIKEGYAYSPYSNSYFSISNEDLKNTLLFYSINENIINKTIPVTQNYNTLLVSNKDIIKCILGYEIIPEIEVTKIKENEYTYLTNGNSVILNKEIKINFSNFDTNKYKYLYSLDDEENTFSLNPISITKNDFQLVINKNCYLHIKIFDLNDNYITNGTYKIEGIKENIIDYSIEDGTEQGKKVIIYYYNFDSTDYFIVDNFQTGKEDKYNSEMMGIITYDNINLDNTYNINAYDKDNNFIKGKIIDIQAEEAKLNNDRYIQLNLSKEKKKIIFHFGNYKKSDKCYYKISNEEEVETKCEASTVLNITKNGYVEIYIKNDNEIVLKKGVNVNFITNLPIFNFESYYNDSESKQVLKIVIDNLKNGDNISYSFDKESWFSLETKRINYLDFYSSSEVYFKVERNSEIVSEAYFDLVYKAFENSSNNNDLQKYNGLKGLLNYFKDITKNVTSEPFKIAVEAYNLIKKSKFSLYILIVIISSIIILFLKSIKR